MKTKKAWKKTAAYLLAACLWLLPATRAEANNLNISNVTYLQASATVTFTISWDNSWYTTIAPNNWDAVWVFIKYQSCAFPTSPWTHALVPASATHTIVPQSVAPGVTLQIDAVSDGMGVFIRRNASGWGSTQVWNCTLKLTPAIAACPTNASCNWRVYGIEMTYIPQGAFWVGDGSGTTTNPFINQQITSAAAITAAVLGGAGTADLPAAYPKGYNAFYCMKSEISQNQYTEFLNSLQYTQQGTRTANSVTGLSTWALTQPSGPPSNRNSIFLSVPGFPSTLAAVYGNDLNNNIIINQAADGLHIACNYLMWGDVTAYLDWAALRPMTELEYEKVCRGVTASVADEYPWGTTNLTIATSAAISNSGAVNEVSTAAPAAGLCVHNGAAGLGPFRTGATTSSTSTRIQAGAAYYGPMEMAGNVWEQVVNVNATGALFTGVLGDGALNATGDANVANWPGTTAAGSGARGGSWFTTTANNAQLRTSDRTSALTGTSTRTTEHGGRGVR